VNVAVELIPVPLWLKIGPAGMAAVVVVVVGAATPFSSQTMRARLAALAWSA